MDADDQCGGAMYFVLVFYKNALLGVASFGVLFLGILRCCNSCFCCVVLCYFIITMLSRILYT